MVYIGKVNIVCVLQCFGEGVVGPYVELDDMGSCTHNWGST